MRGHAATIRGGVGQMRPYGENVHRIFMARTALLLEAGKGNGVVT